jgi:hypothetical protein
MPLGRSRPLSYVRQVFGKARHLEFDHGALLLPAHEASRPTTVTNKRIVVCRLSVQDLQYPLWRLSKESVSCGRKICDCSSHDLRLDGNVTKQMVVLCMEMGKWKMLLPGRKAFCKSRWNLVNILMTEMGSPAASKQEKGFATLVGAYQQQVWISGVLMGKGGTRP